MQPSSPIDIFVCEENKTKPNSYEQTNTPIKNGNPNHRGNENTSRFIKIKDVDLKTNKLRRKATHLK